MRKILLLGLFYVLAFISLHAQNNGKYNKYYIYIENINQENLSKATAFLTKITTANSIDYIAADNVFVVTTYLELDKNIISGKLQKNYLPVTRMVKINDNADDFPKMKNTGDPEKDAADYESEKSKWIKEHPEQYKEMTKQKK